MFIFVQNVIQFGKQVINYIYIIYKCVKLFVKEKKAGTKK